MIRQSFKKHVVQGITLMVRAPGRARRGTGSWKRIWEVSGPSGADYKIKGGTGQCGVGFEISSLVGLLPNTTAKLSQAFEYIATHEAVRLGTSESLTEDLIIALEREHQKVKPLPDPGAAAWCPTCQLISRARKAVRS